MFIGKILETPTKETLQEDGSEFLSVALSIFQEAEEGAEPVFVELRKLAFSLGKPLDEITAEVSKYMRTYNSDYESAIKNKERDDLHKAADETISNLIGKEF